MGRSAWFCAWCAWGLLLIAGSSARAQVAGETQAVGEQAPPSAASATPAATPNEAAPRRMPWRESRERLPAADDETAAETERVWYGWQTLVCDLAGVGLIAVGQEAVPAVIGLVVFGIASPIVHLAHANFENAAISLGIRGGSVGLLFLGAYLVTGHIFDGDGDSPSLSLGVVSIILSLGGALAAVLTDVTLLAFETKPRKRSESSASLFPLIDPQRASYGVALSLAL